MYKNMNRREMLTTTLGGISSFSIPSIEDLNEINEVNIKRVLTEMGIKCTSNMPGRVCLYDLYEQEVIFEFSGKEYKNRTCVESGMYSVSNLDEFIDIIKLSNIEYPDSVITVFLFHSVTPPNTKDSLGCLNTTNKHIICGHFRYKGFDVYVNGNDVFRH